MCLCLCVRGAAACVRVCALPAVGAACKRACADPTKPSKNHVTMWRRRGRGRCGVVVLVVGVVVWAATLATAARTVPLEEQWTPCAAGSSLACPVYTARISVGRDNDVFALVDTRSSVVAVLQPALRQCSSARTSQAMCRSGAAAQALTRVRHTGQCDGEPPCVRTDTCMAPLPGYVRLMSERVRTLLVLGAVPLHVHSPLSLVAAAGHPQRRWGMRERDDAGCGGTGAGTDGLCRPARARRPCPSMYGDDGALRRTRKHRRTDTSMRVLLPLQPTNPPPTGSRAIITRRAQRRRGCGRWTSAPPVPRATAA
jgi:hypothetical protein